MKIEEVESLLIGDAHKLPNGGLKMLAFDVPQGYVYGAHGTG